MNLVDSGFSGVEVAIVGMAGRFPGAPDVDALWHNIAHGVESVTTFGEDELRARGVTPAMLADPAYVRKGIVLDDIDRFDASFFGYSPREAERIDPQHRLLLETAWQALEHAGYAGHAGSKDAPLCGIYAGSGPSLYLHQHLMPLVSLADGDIASVLGVLNGSDPDSLVTRIAYKLDLKGPAVAVQTACSTSLAAVHLACRGLLNHEADLALAGGVWINLLQGRGYRYQQGAILSPDGHCRAFDARAGGTAIGSGAGLVVLKRLADALADGDTIHAVIRGSALNNDGAAKIGYTAPSIDGQAAVIRAAQAMADVAADSIGYVEAHGTGTALGDPIEIAALSQAFGAGKRGYCAIGSVKTNVGHLDAAAGVTGLIKTAMALRHGILPPSLNCSQANPQIDFAGSPFHVNTEARPWPTPQNPQTPRRAGVSSFGMGGTNVHLVLEQAPVASPYSSVDDAMRALLLSARSETALQAMRQDLASHLGRDPQLRMADVAHTLQAGRKRFAHRAVALVRGHGDALQVLAQGDAERFWQGRVLSEQPSVAFLFPGQGAQHANMARAAYQREPVVRQTVDTCCALLQPHLALNLDLRTLLFPAAGQEAEADQRLAQTGLTQPALFVIEYALAQWWIAQGIRPDAMLGHSIGEYVAACVAGVFTLEDALAVVAARARLLQATAPGAMLAVNLSEQQLRERADAGCDLAAVNAPELCVLSGPLAAIERAEHALSAEGVVVRRLHVSHAFHSAQVEPMLAAFEQLLSRVSLSAPRIPFVSNLSGQWITDDEARSPAYWVRHVRAAVRFADGLALLNGKPDRVLLEVGPGDALSVLARRHPLTGARPVLSSQCHPRRTGQSDDQLLRCLAQLFVAGVDVAQAALLAPADGRRVPLPTYPFERERYWLAAADSNPVRPIGATPPVASALSDWFHVPTWQRTPAGPTAASEQAAAVLVLGQADRLSDALCQRLRATGRKVVLVERGQQFLRLGAQHFALRPDERSDFSALLDSVVAEVGAVSAVCHLWNVADEAAGLYSLLALIQSLGERTAHPLTLTVVASQLEDVSGTEALSPHKAVLHGPCKVAPLEYPHIRCKVVDIVTPASGDDATNGRLAKQIATEMALSDDHAVVAWRGPHRWTKHYVAAGHDIPAAPRLRQHGVYLITGGLGGVGMALASYLARQWQARLVLLGRKLSAEQSAAIAALEALGAEVLVQQADVADSSQVQAAVAATLQRFGVLHGVIHAAGVAGGGMIAQRERAAIERVLAPKVQGAANLLAALEASPLAPAPDFILLCSSLSAITGDFGQVDYCAANCVLDAMAVSASRRQSGRVLSVNWDVWRDTGMAAGQQLAEGVGIAPAQAGQLLERLLGADVGAQVLVSSLDIETQLARAATVVLADHLLPALPVLSEPAAPRQSHPRPALASDYLAPADELEQGLAGLWSEFLGIAPLGVADNLFELGGDSLLAIQLLAKVRHAYGVEIQPAAFFQAPTIQTLALLIEERLIAEVEQDAADCDAAHQKTASA